MSVCLNQPTVERVARFLTGRAVGLTLGGGFRERPSRTPCFQRFQRSRYPHRRHRRIQHGAMIGGLFALGWDNEESFAEMRRLLQGLQRSHLSVHRFSRRDALSAASSGASSERLH